MKDFLKNKVVTIVIVIATILLAGVAIFTAIRLYQLRQEAVAPTAPESKPAAQTAPTYGSCQSLAFTITQQEGTPTPTASATPTAPPGEETPTPEPTTPPGEETPTPEPTTPPAGPTEAPTSPPIGGGPTTAPITPASGEPTLPDAGIATPTLVGVGAGIILLIISLALAL